MSKFSIYYNGITKLIPDNNITIDEAISFLTNPMIRDSIEKIREIEDSDHKKVKKLRNQIKKNLSYITPAGVFSERKKTGIQELSGYAVIDIDDLEDVEKTKEKLKKDKYILLMFISPSGDGLKIIIKIPKIIEAYTDYVKSFYQYLNQNYRINISSLDSSTSDISRACYLSYDPQYYYNPKSEEYSDIKHNEENSTIGKPKDNSRSATEFREVIKLLYLGTDKNEIYNYMDQFDKWKTAHPAYKELTYSKAQSYVENNAPSAQEKNDLINELVEIILDKFYIYTIRSDQHPQVYIYSGGIYTSNGKTYIHEFIDRSIGKYYTKTFADKVIEKIMVRTYIEAEEFFKEVDVNFVCVANGILSLKTGELMDFTPDLRFFNKLPVKYDPKAHADLTKKHYQTILKPEDVALMQEIYGFCLLRSYKFQKAFMFSGDGGNGKSISLDQIKSLIGVENSVNLSLETLEKQHFMKVQLHTKLVNLADDIGKAKLTETRTFKEATGGNIITADKKNVDAITFTNYAKMIFNANQIPIIDDDSDGFWRRWVIIRFDVSFLEEPEYLARKEAGTLQSYHRLADTSLVDKLTTPEELSGVLNWAIEGYKRLMKQNGFSYTKSLHETRRYMRRFSSSVIAFTHDCLETIQSPDQYEIVGDLYQSYIKYCFSRVKKIHPESELHFRKLLEEEIPLERKRTANGWEIRAMFTKLNPVIEEK